VPSAALIDLFRLEQEYFHNDRSLKSEDEVRYASLLNRTQNLINLESTLAATTVELDLARADAKLAAIDQEGQSEQQQRIKSLEARLKEQTAQVQQARAAATKDAANYRKEVFESGKIQFIESVHADQVRDRYQELIDAPADGKAAPRAKLISTMDEQIKTARFLEEKKQTDMKFKRADLDVARSDFDCGSARERAAPSKTSCSVASSRSMPR